MAPAGPVPTPRRDDPAEGRRATGTETREVRCLRQRRRSGDRSCGRGDDGLRHHPHLAVSGPIFGFSDTWQLIINTATTVLTFLMVFIIQNTINRDSLAVHVKLDELIRATDEARNRIIGSEKLSETVLEELEHEEEEEARE